jgi:hypothetical protein
MGGKQSTILGLIVSNGPDDVHAIRNENGCADQLSTRFGWSTHNCSCKCSKTGLVLYPSDTQYKNVVLLVCEGCYGYKSGLGQPPQHQQLLNWYYRIYGDSKEFSWVSGFSQKDDGSLGFNSRSCNLRGPYATGNIACLTFEQSIIRTVVNGKLKNYRV